MVPMLDYITVLQNSLHYPVTRLCIFVLVNCGHLKFLCPKNISQNSSIILLWKFWNLGVLPVIWPEIHYRRYVFTLGRVWRWHAAEEQLISSGHKTWTNIAKFCYDNFLWFRGHLLCQNYKGITKPMELYSLQPEQLWMAVLVLHSNSIVFQIFFKKQWF